MSEGNSSQDKSTALAKRDAGGLDEYQRRFMATQGAVLHAERRAAPKLLQLLIGSTMLAGIGMLFTPAWMGGLLMIPLGFLMWMLFAVLRVTVTEGIVNVQYGVFGPTIPVEKIESAEAVEYDWKKFGGWGIRRSLDGEWMYSMPGDKGRAVRIVWTNEKGKRVVTNVGMADPDPTANAIQQALRSLGPGEKQAELPSAEDAKDVL